MWDLIIAKWHLCKLFEAREYIQPAPYGNHSLAMAAYIRYPLTGLHVPLLIAYAEKWFNSLRWDLDTKRKYTLLHNYKPKVEHCYEVEDMLQKWTLETEANQIKVAQARMNAVADEVIGLEEDMYQIAKRELSATVKKAGTGTIAIAIEDARPALYIGQRFLEEFPNDLEAIILHITDASQSPSNFVLSSVGTARDIASSNGGDGNGTFGYF